MHGIYDKLDLKLMCAIFNFKTPSYNFIQVQTQVLRHRRDIKWSYEWY